MTDTVHFFLNCMLWANVCLALLELNLGLYIQLAPQFILDISPPVLVSFLVGSAESVMD